MLWLLFIAGGVAAAMIMAVTLFLFGVAFPLGWLAPPRLHSAAHDHQPSVDARRVVRGLLAVALPLGAPLSLHAV